MRVAGEAFEKLDVDGSGELEREEITQLAGQMGNFAGNEEERERKIDQFFKDFDTDGDGMISKQEWVDFFGRQFDLK